MRWPHFWPPPRFWRGHSFSAHMLYFASRAAAAHNGIIPPTDVIFTYVTRTARLPIGQSSSSHNFYFVYACQRILTQATPIFITLPTAASLFTRHWRSLFNATACYRRASSSLTEVAQKRRHAALPRPRAATRRCRLPPSTYYRVAAMRGIELDISVRLD